MAVADIEMPGVDRAGVDRAGVDRAGVEMAGTEIPGAENGIGGAGSDEHFTVEVDTARLG